MTVRHFAAISCFILMTVMTTSLLAYDLEEVKERGVLKVALYNNFPPYSYEDKGKPAGIDVDIAEQIGNKLGLPVKVRLVGADENMEDDLRNNVWKGHYLGGGVADMMIHAPYDREYAEEVDQVKFLAPYFLESIAFAIDTKKLGNEPTIANFGYDKVGVELDTLSDFYLLGAINGRIRPNVVHYLSISQAVEGLKNGEVAAVMGPKGELQGAIHGAPEGIQIKRLITPGLSRSSWAVGIAIKEDRPMLIAAVDQAMAGLIADGSIQKIFESYGVSYIAPAAP